MIIVNFKNHTTKTAYGLWQWDYGQVLRIEGLDLPTATEVHFSVQETGGESITRIGMTKDGVTDVVIPDSLLENNGIVTNYFIYAFVYITDETSGQTEYVAKLEVKTRPKPEAFDRPEDAELFREAIKAVNDSADRAETAADTSEKNAKKTAEDRTAISEMVETVSGIEQQVQDVKKYAGKAETAASNAALSEQESKKSATAALQAKADAETAKGGAETAAGKTAEDRTAVERAKEEVLQAKQQVSTDREAVEAVERKVAQMGNTIPQAVLEGVQEVGSAGAAEKQGIVQAGTEQKSAVESAGTKAVEDIVLAKKTATDAVETAKTGAVGAVGTAGTEQTKNVTAEGEKQVKAVADKGAEVLQSIPEDFTVQMQSKLDKNQGIENAGKAMVINPEGVIVPGEVTGGDGIPIINTASGESPLVVTDSAERVNKGFGLGGNTEQAATTGKNLADEEKLKKLSNYTKDSIVYFVYKITGLLQGEKYTLSRGNVKTGEKMLFGIVVNQQSKDNAQFLIYDSLGDSYNRKAITWTQEIGDYAEILFSYNAQSGEVTQEKIDELFQRVEYIQLEKGIAATSYEPYTGGKPSPSLEYQQEIKNVGKWNPETRKYEVDVRVTGKNLIGEYNIFDSKGIDASGNVIDKPNACISDLILIQKGQQHTISLNNVDGITVSAYLYDRDRKYIGYYFATKSETREFVQDENCFIRFIFPKPKTYILETDIQLELRKGRTSYEPQKEPQTLTLTSERPITKWDKLAEKDGEIGWLFKSEIIGKFDGKSNRISLGAKKGNVQHFSVEFKNTPKGNGSADIYVDKYRAVQSSYALEEFGICCNWNDGIKYFSAPNINITNTEEFKAWLSENPLTVEYETETPEFVPLQQPEQDAIRALKTYYPTTVITVDGGEVIPSVELTYTADTKNFILNREKVMQAQMLNIQSALISQKISGGV